MYQSTEVIGRLGANPEVRSLPDGGFVANMRIATDESYKNPQGVKVERTEWHRVVLYSKLAEVARDYCTVGKLVFIEGKIRTRKWTDDKNVERYTTEIIGNKLRMLDKGGKDPQAVAEAKSDDNADMVPVNDVPF